MGLAPARAFAHATSPPPDTIPVVTGGPPLLARRLCFVIGKGGVGKSSVAAALGMSRARAGARTLIVEVPTGEHRSALFTRAGVRHGHEVEIAPNLFGLSINVERATEEYLASQLRVKTMVELLARSHAFHHFAAAAPGLAELVTIGKIWALAVALRPDGSAPVWDTLVIDCPATGHGLALLEMAGNVSNLAASGPDPRPGRAHQPGGHAPGGHRDRGCRAAGRASGHRGDRDGDHTRMRAACPWRLR